MPPTLAPTVAQAPTPTAANVTAEFASSYDLTGVVVLLVYVVAVLAAAQFVAPWLARSQLLSGVGRRLVASLVYAIKGAAASAVLVVAGLPVYLVATADGGIRSAALQLLAAIGGAYIALVVVGWLADRAAGGFIDAHPEYDEWADIWDGEADESPEPVADGGRPDE